MGRARRRCCLGAGAAIAGASLIAAPVSSPAPHIEMRDVQFTSGDGADSPLGDGTALVMGGSSIPIPPQSYVNAADTLYLQPRDFTGTPQALDTPEGFYPTTGVNSLTADASEAQGAQILNGAITGQIADGNVDAANPVVVFGYSQSSALSTMTMEQLWNQGVPSDDVHFVLVGDTAAPNGGLLERFTDLSVPSFGITFGNPTPDDLYPTDVYTLEYDGFADFPQYPIDPLSDLNAFAGMIYEHLTYLDLDPGQIQNAIPLETTGDSLTDYYMIGVQDLPLLDPLRLIPFVGNPLADLLQPDVTVLVNLGYGSITDGWSQGPANVATPFELFPTDLNWSDVFTALLNGVPQGIEAAIADLENPDNYQIPSLLDNPTLAPLVDAAFTSGLIDTLQPTPEQLTQALLGGNFPLSDATLLSPPTDLVNDFTSTISADYAALLPIADTINALTTTMPAYDASLFVDQLEAGNLLGAIGDPIAADVALIPFAIFLGAGPITDAVEGTLLNIANLIP
ncbi:MAG: PE-PPE domain-containing protein [Mycobacterium sp.]|uniref:PE-PPE domain-containing protein n=1 Tax=Mycobacterium sp. TaxID=1785 RepID=UPI003C793EE4